MTMMHKLFSSLALVLPKRLAFGGRTLLGYRQQHYPSSTNFFFASPSRINLFLVPLAVSAVTATDIRRDFHSCQDNNNQNPLNNFQSNQQSVCQQKSFFHSSSAMQSESSGGGPSSSSPANNSPDWKKLSNEEWAERLSPEAYFSMREGGTEAPFTGQYVNHKAEGVYKCAGCGSDLFTSKAKYDSGSGWPSFFSPAEEDGVVRRKDISHGMVRTEILCATCNAHLGHVFDDGPRPTGERFCVNSVALKFVPKKIS